MYGIILKKKISDKVEKGEVLAYIHSNDEQKGVEAFDKLQDIYEFSDTIIEKEKYILEII